MFHTLITINNTTHKTLKNFFKTTTNVPDAKKFKLEFEKAQEHNASLPVKASATENSTDDKESTDKQPTDDTTKTTDEETKGDVKSE
jgi:hypothetical protein